MRKIGAVYTADECEFIVWSPFSQAIDLYLSDEDKKIRMKRDSEDYWKVSVEDIQPGSNYFFLLNGNKRGDPASCYQPGGINGPSQIVDHSSFEWQDGDFTPVQLKDYIIYEFHTGTFTADGTFESAAGKLDYLKDLGITAIEIMPVAQFPGGRNWGYDGVFPFAPQNSYGGPEGLKMLVNEAHKKGFSVILDVVYNHLGPEGNYLHEFGPYFTDKYKSLWGNSVNFDQAYSDHVRNYFIYNAIYWLSNYHIDALRLDAVHAINDLSAYPFLAELASEVEKYSETSGKKHYLIAESDLNDEKVIRPLDNYGYGCDAQWSDDFHHSVHTLLTQESDGYYSDFGNTGDLAKAIKNNFVYDGKYSAYRKRKHGNSPSEFSFDKFVHFIQNHDQVGNRALGERLSELIPFEGLKLAAALLIFSPSLPMLFMGEEYAENNPFLYFVSFLDENLNQAVKKGRGEEFESFKWEGDIPDPHAESTFTRSKLDWAKIKTNNHKALLDFYKDIIKKRKTIPALINYDRRDTSTESFDDLKIVTLERRNNSSRLFALMSFNEKEITAGFSFSSGVWKKILDSSEKKWNGPGSLTPDMADDTVNEITIPPYNFSLYESELG
jgi:maltooligosyltrehalose trehalohydrolase